MPQTALTSFPLQTPEHNIELARRDFFDRSRQPTGLVSKDILGSWQRCIDKGMVVGRIATREPLTPGELTPLLDRSELFRLVGPVLKFLESVLMRTESVIAFADRHGTVIHSLAGDLPNGHATKEALAPGTHWSEEDRGTNGIGTAIAERRLVEIWGGEHFHAEYGAYTCTAAPVLDHTGAIAGVINVTGDLGLPRGYARAVIKRAVREIEYRWLTQISSSLNRFCFHPQFTHVKTTRAGVLLLDENQVVGANRYALQWLGMDWSIIGKRWEECFETPLPMVGAAPVLPRQRVQFAYEMSTAERKYSTALRQKQAGSTRLRPPPGTWFNQGVLAQLDRALRATNAGLTTIVLGETGTGKEMFARAVHFESTRRSQPFVAINCAALPEALIESELFGYHAGAFTGAKRNGSPGRILEASGGILFLDEIGDMPSTLQTRLLRVLQDKQVTPLGGGAAQPVDLVVMCATHRNIEAMIVDGIFRADLYFRLNHLIVGLPAFREYPEVDRLAALDFIWKDSGAEARGLRLSDEARNCLAACAWPGNFRQCANTIRTLIALSDDGVTLEVDSLPPDIRTCVTAPIHQEGAPLHELTSIALERALARHNGDINLAAKELGVHRATLYRQIKRRSIRIE